MRCNVTVTGIYTISICRDEVECLIKVDQRTYFHAELLLPWQPNKIKALSSSITLAQNCYMHYILIFGRCERASSGKQERQ